MSAGPKNRKRTAYHVRRPDGDVVQAHLRKRLLEFIRARFWMMPVEPDRSGFGGAEWQKNVERTERFLMLQTRKAMITEVIHGWRGIPHDENDELAFAMLSDMAEPRLGICPAPAGTASDKMLIDHLRVKLSDGLPTCTTWAYDTMMGYGNLPGRLDPPSAWLYWLTVGDDAKMSRHLRVTLAKNRAHLMGPTAVARELREALALRAMVQDASENK